MCLTFGRQAGRSQARVSTLLSPRLMLTTFTEQPLPPKNGETWERLSGTGHRFLIIL